MKILHIYPQCPDTFWSFKHAIRFISKKAAEPPLGLLTVAAMLPKEWEKKLVDMNISPLHDNDLEWADYVFLSAMSVQEESAKRVISRCKRLGVKIVAGGPLFTVGYDDFEDVDHLVLNEAEITLPPFLEDLANECAKHIYTSKEFPHMGKTPIPLWELLDMKNYATMDIQYSRGCPFNCEFCNVTTLNGHKVRTKSSVQITEELENLYAQGWRGDVLFVDDNFIANKTKLKKDVLPAIIHWMRKRKHPFNFSTQASIDIADDEELMHLMVQAGFDSVFIGIETPDMGSLAECGKIQNMNRDLVACVKRIQQFGMQVKGGFIVGFDRDSASIFRSQIDFVQKSGIVNAMVGLLNAPRDSGLYRRLAKENRLLKESSGDNTDFSTNFVPKMGYETLLKGYQEILSGIYSYKPYYERIRRLLREYKPLQKRPIRFRFNRLGAFFKSIWFIGIKEKGKIYYWHLLFWAVFRNPRLFPTAITLTIMGYHFRKVYGRHL
ncbi:MAG: DUF4070 domain-containing protein [Calditrichaeota bacterium]|nr:DUF4070 domain-containing protein [Calditrichota bacterium]